MLTNSMLLESTPDLAVRFGQTSTLTQWRDRDRRRSNLRTASLGYAEGGRELRTNCFRDCWSTKRKV